VGRADSHPSNATFGVKLALGNHRSHSNGNRIYSPGNREIKWRDPDSSPSNKRENIGKQSEITANGKPLRVKGVKTPD
jgi:hypothetical protein